MSTISTHVLDTSTGTPAEGIDVQLEFQKDHDLWISMARGTTSADGRLRVLASADDSLTAGIYRLVFATGDYHARAGLAAFYPQITLEFRVKSGESHCHVPLLLSPFGYSTYRGS